MLILLYSLIVKSRYLIGIDEVGRGPIAGPVCVGVFCCDKKVLAKILKNAPCAVTDSKKMTAKNREAIVAFLKTVPDIFYAVGYSSSDYIDRHGITKSIQAAIHKALKKIPADCTDTYLLDGSLSLPPEYKKQQTIIKGDLNEPTISLASIVAKVERDAHMVNLAKKYPDYCFEKHKGYGTKDHYLAIQKHGATPLHRRTFLKGVI